MKVYVVTDGEYSDYHIEAVFTDEGQALLYCATHCGELEEYEADEVRIEATKKVVEMWTARFDFNGCFVGTWKERYCFGFKPNIVFNRYGCCFFVESCLPLCSTKEQAKKYFCDLFATFKQQASDEGLTLLEMVRRSEQNE